MKFDKIASIKRLKVIITVILLISSCKDVSVKVIETGLKDSLIAVKYIDSIILGAENFNQPEFEKRRFEILKDSIKNYVFNGKNVKNKKRDSLIFESLDTYHDYCGNVRYSPNYMPRIKGLPYDSNWYVYTNQYVGGDDSLLSFFKSRIRHEVQIPESYFDSTGQYNLCLKFKVGGRKKISELSISTNSKKEYIPFSQEISRLCFMLPCWKAKTYYVDNNYKGIRKELIEMRYCYLLSIDKNSDIKLKLINKQKSN